MNLYIVYVQLLKFIYSTHQEKIHRLMVVGPDRCLNPGGPGQQNKRNLWKFSFKKLTNPIEAMDIKKGLKNQLKQT